LPKLVDTIHNSSKPYNSVQFETAAGEARGMPVYSPTLDYQ